MDQTQLEALLGRSLSAVEQSNLELYLELANEALGVLLCTPIASASETRKFGVREGYKTAFIDIFRSVSVVKIDGTTVDASDYSLRQWDARTGSWYNSIVFENPFKSYDKEIEVTAEWGFNTSGSNELPTDLQLLIAGLFDLISKRNNLDQSVSSKQVEDFRISFNNDVDLDKDFYNKYQSIISKYSICDIPNVQHGGYRYGCI